MDGNYKVVWEYLPKEFEYLKEPITKALLQYEIYDDAKLLNLLKNITDEYYYELADVGAQIKQRNDLPKLNKFMNEIDWKISAEAYHIFVFINLLDLLDIELA